MKELLIMRHAKSSWPDEEIDDHERPLNKRGLRDAPRMGDLLRSNGIVPERIVSSTARRAQETARRVAKACGGAGELVADSRLYTGDAPVYLAVLAEQNDALRSVLLVGHNPTIESLVELLTGSAERMPTAALVRLELPLESWSGAAGAPRARLLGCWRPKELRD